MSRLDNGPVAVFRNNGSSYWTQLIGHKNHGKFYSPVGNFHQGIAMFSILDEFKEKEIGGIMFTAGVLANAIWKNFDQKSSEYFESIDDTSAIFTNLLNHLPLDLKKLPNWDTGKCFEFRFDTQIPEGLMDGNDIYVIDAKDGIQKNIKRLVLGDESTGIAVQKELKYILWDFYNSHPGIKVGISVNRLSKMMGITEDVTKSYMVRLVDSHLAKPVSETDQAGIISIMVEYALVEEMEGCGKDKMSSIYNDNRKFITIEGGINASGGGQVAIAQGENIQQEFERIISEVSEMDELHTNQKEEVKKLILELEAEMGKGKKDENKIVGLLKQVGSISNKVLSKLTDNSTLAPFIVYYLAKVVGLPLP